MLEASRHGETEDKKDEALDDRLSVIAEGEKNSVDIKPQMADSMQQGPAL